MIDIAYDVLNENKDAVLFIDLWNEVSTKKGLTDAQKEDAIAQFYTDLSLDGRFITMEDNKWDLKKRHRLDELKSINIDEFLDDEDEDIEEE